MILQISYPWNLLFSYRLIMLVRVLYVNSTFLKYLLRRRTSCPCSGAVPFILIYFSHILLYEGFPVKQNNIGCLRLIQVEPAEENRIVLKLKRLSWQRSGGSVSVFVSAELSQPHQEINFLRNDVYQYFKLRVSDLISLAAK